MLEGLKNAGERIVGLRQTLRALAADEVAVVYIADDADESIKNRITEAIGQADVNLVYAGTMEDIKNACGIEVGCACAAVKR